MNDATTENALALDYQRARAILQAEGRVSASLIQRRLGIGYISALHLASELNGTKNGLATDVHLVLDSRTLHLLIAMCAAPCDGEYIGIAEEDF